MVDAGRNTVGQVTRPATGPNSIALFGTAKPECPIGRLVHWTLASRVELKSLFPNESFDHRRRIQDRQVPKEGT